MSNMSYCRWQNTYSDLRDCAADLEERTSEDEERGPLSREERAAMVRTLELCVEMLEQIGYIDGKDDVDTCVKDIK